MAPLLKKRKGNEPDELPQRTSNVAGKMANADL